MAPRGAVLAVLATCGAAVLAFAACEQSQESLPPRSTTPVADEAGLDAAPVEADAASDAPSDAPPEAMGDAGPTGARFVATGAGFHPALGYGDHSCAIAGADRSVYCWGANDHGQIGNGKVADAGMTDAGSTDAGDAGFGDAGGLPDDLTAAVKIPTDEMGLPLTGVDELSLAAWHSCARAGDAMYCWGQRYAGAQAEPPFAQNPDRSRPRAIGNLLAWSIAAGGPHTCALKRNGKVTCFGHSYFNELGRPKADDPTCEAPLFYDYPGFTPPHTCSGEALDISAPIVNAAQVAAGELHSCARADGNVWCWGTNESGQLGNPVAGTAELNPMKVLADPGNLPLTNVALIASGGGRHTCALAVGRVHCWGSNEKGELASDPATLTKRASAGEIPGVIGALAIGVGDGVSCAVKADATAVCWGADDVGQLGDGAPKASSFAPVTVKGPGGLGTLTGVLAIAPGRRHVCALRSDATVWCWGKNDRGQLGDGTRADSLYPVKVTGLPP
jgi:alpha-tubulin suppressor-like RCC1 family protein